MAAGDMPSFDDSVNLALNGAGNTKGLKDSNARHKHIIIISDGDPAPPQKVLMDQCKALKVSVSTVTVYPHTGNAASLPPEMEDIPKNAWPGGKAFGPINTNPNQLPEIFIKQASIVKRTLIHEQPEGIDITMRDPSDEMVAGLPTPLPSVLGMVLTSRKNDPKVLMPMSAGKMNDPVLAHWQTGLGKAAVWTADAHNKWALNWINSPAYSKLFAQIIRAISRPPMSGDFEVRMNLDGPKGEITVEALNKDADFQNFLNFSGTVAGGKDLKSPPQEMRLVQVAPGTYKGTFELRGEGSYVSKLNFKAPNGTSGFVMGGGVMNSSPERRELKSNEILMEHIRSATGGRLLEPFDPRGAEVFSREGIVPSSSPLRIWDRLILALVALMIVDVAVRRIAWDWASIKKMARAVSDRIGFPTHVRTVETRQSLDALRGVRDRVAESRLGAGAAAAPAAGGVAPPLPQSARPDPKAKFVAPKGVEGDLSQVVGGATDKPIPAAPKKIEPKGTRPGSGDHIGGLMAAKRRAQQQIKDKEQGEGQG